MVQLLEQKKRRSILIIILVIVVIITGIVWYSSVQKEKSVGIVTIPGGTTREALILNEAIKNIKLDFTVFDDSLFKSLKSHGALPVVAGETGKDNPFAP